MFVEQARKTGRYRDKQVISLWSETRCVDNVPRYFHSMGGGYRSFSSGGITEYINLRVYRDQHLSGSQSCVTRRLPMRDRSRFAISDPVHANIVLRSNKGLAFTFTASKEKEGKIVFEEFLRHARKSHI